MKLKMCLEKNKEEKHLEDFFENILLYFDVRIRRICAQQFRLKIRVKKRRTRFDVRNFEKFCKFF